MALLACGTRDVGARLFAFHNNQKRLARREPVECQASPDECHRTDISGDVEFVIGSFHLPAHRSLLGVLNIS